MTVQPLAEDGSTGVYIDQAGDLRLVPVPGLHLHTLPVPYEGGHVSQIAWPCAVDHEATDG